MKKEYGFETFVINGKWYQRTFNVYIFGFPVDDKLTFALHDIIDDIDYSFDMIKENIEKYHFIVLENEPIHASSTEIRNGRIEMLNPEVLK